MFWNGTYVVFREIEKLLEKEPISLSELIDADDILQECKTQNKKLVEFLVRPDTLAELISLITEEPSKNLELSRRYRKASMACEILTSEIPGISQLLSNDQNLMNKLCDFIAQPVPLNPLLASFFSKTIEMLLARRPVQDYYSYQIVCLRVLEFFKQRQDFLPNLLKHIGTSAIMDTFKHLIWIEGIEIQPGAMEWLDSYRLIEQLVEIICGTHNLDDVPLRVNSEVVNVNQLANGVPEQDDVHKQSDDDDDDDDDKVINMIGDETVQNDETERDEEISDCAEMEKWDSEDKLEDNKDEMLKESPFDKSLEYEIRITRERLLAGQSANAAHLLAEIVHMSMEVEYITAQIQKSVSNPLWDKSISQATIELLLQSMFTAPEDTREDAIVNGVQVLLAILQDKEFEEIEDVRLRESLNAHKCALYKSALKGAIAPHLPLLHQVLLQGPAKHKLQLQYGGKAEGRVGRARLAVVSLLERAVCVSSCHAELAHVLHALGTLSLLIDMFLSYKWNNFLHTHVKNVFVHMTEYALFLDYADAEVISRLIDTWEEENDGKNVKKARSGYMGHLTKMLEALSRSLMLTVIPNELKERYETFFTQKLAYVLHLESTPLGGQHPADRPETEADYDENSTYAYSTYNSNWSRYEASRQENDFSRHEETFNTYSKDYYEDRLAEDEEDFRQVKQLFDDRNRYATDEAENEKQPPEPKAAWDDEDEDDLEGEGEKESKEAGQTRDDDDLASSPSSPSPLVAASPWDSVGGVTPSTSADEGWANFNAFADPTQAKNTIGETSQADAWASGSSATEREGWADFDALQHTEPATVEGPLATEAPPAVQTPTVAKAPPAMEAAPEDEAPHTSPLESFAAHMAAALEGIDDPEETQHVLPDNQSSSEHKSTDKSESDLAPVTTSTQNIEDSTPTEDTETSEPDVDNGTINDLLLTSEEGKANNEETEKLQNVTHEKPKSDVEDKISESKDKPINVSENKMAADSGQVEERR